MSDEEARERETLSRLIQKYGIYGVEVTCEWCEATVKLDDMAMLQPHVRPDDGADCAGAYGDDYEWKTQ